MTASRYRSIFHTRLTAADAFSAAQGALRGWLRSKQLDVDAFDQGNARLGPGTFLLHNSRNTPDGTQTKRWQLRETGGPGAWVSALTVHAPGRAPEAARTWFWLDVEFMPAALDEAESGRGRKAAVPRLIGELLDQVPANDSLATLTRTPRLIRPDDVDELIDVLCDPDRRLPTIVATAHAKTPFEEWRRTVETVTKNTAGLAGLYLLDPYATEHFNKEIGSSHGVWGGSIRTFLPEVDPAGAEDAVRHRVLSAARIELDVRRAVGLLSGLPRTLSAESRLPAALAGITRTLLLEDTPKQAQARTSAPAEMKELRTENDQLRRNLHAAFELIAEAARNEDRIADLNEQLQALSAEFDTVNQKAVLLEDQVRGLQRRLVHIGHEKDAFEPQEQRTILPGSFAELLDRMEELSRIVFTGDIGLPLGLDEMPNASSWAQTTWQALLALNSYADARAADRFAGSFLQWCKEPPVGEYAIPAGKVAADESEAVKKDMRMRRQHTFPVPPKVDAKGRLFMGAHIRIGGGAGMRAPRMHYHDGVKAAGLICVGYIGPHLKVKSTN
ncbi:hypothetical protein HTZ77_18375 [Nonomuraea sp. SMC257]|uniref:Uncharacterized protein n=1 Tax=Nonomuraea montanisoli TaxID=2741721 RepID=A0A7Y6M4D3_9ACTN|nr:hypothetical protein [Nonomuraea montanisoli]NUW33380.1 hypothetical protein [Nonomuraea montanisoli]